MNREIISKLYKEAVDYCVEQGPNPDGTNKAWIWEEKFTELIVKECINKIEEYRIPVGNSRSGEMACKWTYDALKEIRDDIKETFGVSK